MRIASSTRARARRTHCRDSTPRPRMEGQAPRMQVLNKARMKVLTTARMQGKSPRHAPRRTSPRRSRSDRHAAWRPSTARCGHTWRDTVWAARAACCSTGTTRASALHSTAPSAVRAARRPPPPRAVGTAATRALASATSGGAPRRRGGGAPPRATSRARATRSTPLATRPSIWLTHSHTRSALPRRRGRRRRGRRHRHRRHGPRRVRPRSRRPPHGRATRKEGWRRGRRTCSPSRLRSAARAGRRTSCALGGQGALPLLLEVHVVLVDVHDGPIIAQRPSR